MSRIAVLFALIIGLTNPALAQERSSLFPDIPKASGAPHPEGNAFWRENHPDLLRHDRDRTVRDGEREIQASLKGCMVCHAVTNESGNVVTYESEQNFCRVCHEYVAVKIDCFICHRSTPDGVDEDAFESTLLPPAELKPEIKPLVAYLEGLQGTGATPPIERQASNQEVSE
jgi:[DsrC]-trisulfide reductase subunit J